MAGGARRLMLVLAAKPLSTAFSVFPTRPHHRLLHRSAISISSNFDAGNIEEVEQDVDGGEVSLRIKRDIFTELEQVAHCQWFCFRASGAITDATKFHILNAGEASYAPAWKGYTVCASYDKQDWFRCPDTVFDEAAGRLTWTLKGAAVHPSGGGENDKNDKNDKNRVVTFAYFAPYSYERHQWLVGRAAQAPQCRSARVLGKTLDGRDMDLLVLGNGPTQVWVIARQHPGEPMAEWFVEGLLDRLTGGFVKQGLGGEGTNGGGGAKGDSHSDEEGCGDAKVKAALADCTWHIVPNMNPDGAVRGHLRVNAGGTNLNREWGPTPLQESHPSHELNAIYEAPTQARSPEVHAVLGEMDATGVDLFVDVHGDELVPLNFLAGMEGLAQWAESPRLQALQGAFAASYARAAAPGDMQVKYSYAPSEPGSANLAICSNQVAHRFGCLGVTLEQPFKDCASAPEPARGWSPDRAAALGASLVDAACHVRPLLREEGPFWETLAEEDAYVRPLEGKGDSAL